MCGLQSTGFGKAGHCDFGEGVLCGTVVGPEAGEEGGAEDTWQTSPPRSLPVKCSLAPM